MVNPQTANANCSQHLHPSMSSTRGTPSPATAADRWSPCRQGCGLELLFVAFSPLQILRPSVHHIPHIPDRFQVVPCSEAVKSKLSPCSISPYRTLEEPRSRGLCGDCAHSTSLSSRVLSGRLHWQRRWCTTVPRQPDRTHMPTIHPVIR